MLDLILFYCSLSAATCVYVRPVLDPPLTQFSQCEFAGRSGDANFQAAHPDWHLRSWTCTRKTAPGLPV